MLSQIAGSVPSAATIQSQSPVFISTASENPANIKNTNKPPTKTAKIIQSGLLTKAVTIKGIKVTSGAKVSIEAAGGKVEV